MSFVRFLALTFALILISHGRLRAQDAVSDWFPVHVGDKWVYEHTTRDDIGEGRAHLDVHTWKTEEMTVGTWTVPEGTIIERRVQVVEGSPPAGSRVSASPIFLIRGNCLYQPEYGEAEWNSVTHTLAPNFLKGLSSYSSPDFCFPLVMNKKWGAPHGLPDWGVTRPEDAKDWQVLGTKLHDRVAPERHSTFHIANISSYPGSGMTVDVWFEKGVGIVRQVEIHHGTVGEERTRLLRFAPAAAR